MNTPDPPAAPDPVATANAQANANVQTAVGNSILNNANVNGPTGSTKFDITGYQTIKDVNGQDIQVPRYTQTTTLTPEQQQLYNQNAALAHTSNDIAATALNKAAGVLGQPTTTSPTLATSYGSGGPIQTGVNLKSDLSSTDFSADRDATTNAVLARLQPQMDNSDAALSASLANQGITMGSPAWQAAMSAQAGSKNDLRLGAVQTGNAEQQALFAEKAQAQSQDNAALLGAAQFGNAAQAQANGQNQAAAAFGNNAGLQQYQADVSARETPLNEISALRSGGQVTMPQFNGYQGGVIAQTPYSDDVYKSAAIDQQNYQTQVQQNSAMMSGLFGLGSKAFGLFGMSDRRLKRDVRPLGRMPNGLELYAYRYTWDDALEVGHMADEVAELYPDAVGVHPSGFLMVDYGRL